MELELERLMEENANLKTGVWRPTDDAAHHQQASQCAVKPVVDAPGYYTFLRLCCDVYGLNISPCYISQV